MNDTTPLETTGEPLGPQAAAALLEPGPIDGAGAEPGAEVPPAPGAGPTPSDVEAWKTALSMSLGVAFGLVAQRWPTMALSKDETRLLADAWAPVCAIRFGGAMSLETSAMLATCMVLGPKVLATYEHERNARDNARADAAHDVSSEPGTTVT